MKTKTSILKPEILVTLLCLGISFFFLHPLLIGKTILAHDNFYWNFPIFHYTAVTLMNGSLPLWDPFSNGGQPFYPHLIQFRLLEPIILMTIGLGQFFTKNTVILFNLSKILQTLCMCWGAYLCLKRYASKTFTRVLLIPILLLSSFSLGAFHQDGILSQFVWIPWIAHFLLAIFFEKDHRWFRFLLLSVFIGLSWQSYQFVGTWTFLFLFLIGMLLFHRKEFLNVFKAKVLRLKLFMSFLIIFGMMAPNIALISESSRFIFPLRMAPKDFKERLMNETGLLPSEVEPGDVEIGIKMPYEMIPYTGAMVKVWELIQTFSPNANPNIFVMRNPDTWGTPSEAYIYIGLFAWALCLFGFTLGIHVHKKLWLLLTVSFGLLMMGPPGGLHRVLFYIFPPLWFIRHTTLFVLFFLIGCLYFFVIGLERAQEKQFRLHIPKTAWASIIPYTVVLFTFLVLATKLDYPVFKFPETNFVFVIFLVLSAAAWKILPIIRKEGLYFSLIVSQIAIVLFLCPKPLDSGMYLISFLLIPMFSFNLSQRQKKARILLQTFIVLLFVTDLSYSFWSAGRLYASQESPDILFNLPMTNQEFKEQNRQVYPSYPFSLYGRQAPRYLSLLHQKPFALSGVLHFKNSEDREYPQDMAFALSSKRWNSYLMEKNYFKTIHLDIPPTVLSKLFFINERIFQFRSNAFPEPAFLDLAKKGFGEKILDNSVITDESTPIQQTASNLNKAEIETLSYSYNTWKGMVKTEGSGYFIFGDGFDRFWRASVDEKNTTVLKVNLNSKAVFLTKGTHSVEFKYIPLPFLITTALFLFIPLLVVIFLLLESLTKITIGVRLRNPLPQH